MLNIGYIGKKLENGCYSDIIEFCKTRQFDKNFEEDFATIVTKITGVNCKYNSWRASVNVLIENYILQKNKYNINYNRKYDNFEWNVTLDWLHKDELDEMEEVGLIYRYATSQVFKFKFVNIDDLEEYKLIVALRLQYIKGEDL